MSILFNVRHEAEDTFPPTAPWTYTFPGTNGDPPDPVYWTRNVAYEEELITIQDNECLFDNDDAAGAHTSTMRSVFALEGDFDIEFEFTLHTFETAGVVNQYVPLMYIKRQDTGTNYGYVARAKLTAGINGYVSDGNILGTNYYNKADASGKMRMTRISNAFTVYEWDTVDGRWEWNGNPSGRTVGNLVGFDMYVDFIWTSQNSNYIQAAIDNFKINSGTPIAP